MPRTNAFPLDLKAVAYSYVERPNTVLLELLQSHVIANNPASRVLDIGCGAGANARALRDRYPSLHLTGIEPSSAAAQLAKEACTEVFVGTSSDWITQRSNINELNDRFDAVLLSDVLEHIPDPLAFLRELRSCEALRDATFIVSVPNYAVWYNRATTLMGRFQYAWSGLYDRTHLRFFTRHSVQELMEYAGIEVVGDSCTPSLVQSMAPLLRTFFEKDVAAGDHLSLPKSRAFQTYDRWVEPGERKLCELWPELLGFQIVSVGRIRKAH